MAELPLPCITGKLGRELMKFVLFFLFHHSKPKDWESSRINPDQYLLLNSHFTQFVGWGEPGEPQQFWCLTMLGFL